MAKSYQIIIRNNSNNNQYFYIYQIASQFDQTPTTIYSSSLGTTFLANYATSGSQATFTTDDQLYAGALSTATTLQATSFVLTGDTFARSSSALAKASLSTTASQPVTTTGQTLANATQLAIDPLGLSVPTSNSAVPVGAFRISVPAYVPLTQPDLFVGSATIVKNQVILSSFIAPAPNQFCTCTPQQVFFVGVGNQAAGTTITYQANPSSRCDFTTGASQIIVTYNSNGTFSTSSS